MTDKRMKRFLTIALALTCSAAGVAWAQPAHCNMANMAASSCHCCNHLPSQPQQLSCTQHQSEVHVSSLTAEIRKASDTFWNGSLGMLALAFDIPTNVSPAFTSSTSPSHAPPKRYLLYRIFRL